MKYLIVEEGASIFGGDTVYGYVTTETKALLLCTSLNNQPNGCSNFYFEKIEESAQDYNRRRICLDYMVSNN